MHGIYFNISSKDSSIPSIFVIPFLELSNSKYLKNPFSFGNIWTLLYIKTIMNYVEDDRRASSNLSNCLLRLLEIAGIRLEFSILRKLNYHTENFNNFSLYFYNSCWLKKNWKELYNNLISLLPTKSCFEVIEHFEIWMLHYADW